ncbi:hypothetical protein EZS27_034571 [termite gut metagenome]|jgi:hypothetical protein|uniref:Uncharacterized protein n=1 Tax=termite gut metagenome TaxID=433724 RepID=A0A5J4Q2T4_9ZZZZ
MGEKNGQNLWGFVNSALHLQSRLGKRKLRGDI